MTITIAITVANQGTTKQRKTEVVEISTIRKISLILSKATGGV